MFTVFWNFQHYGSFFFDSKKPKICFRSGNHNRTLKITSKKHLIQANKGFKHDFLATDISYVSAAVAKKMLAKLVKLLLTS